uniref:PPUP7948 n=1 Tax=Poeciliopsis prolifica TaxID=188132 RepID=A0A0S7EMM5_9TELE
MNLSHFSQMKSKSLLPQTIKLGFHGGFSSESCLFGTVSDAGGVTVSAWLLLLLLSSVASCQIALPPCRSHGAGKRPEKAGRLRQRPKNAKQERAKRAKRAVLPNEHSRNPENVKFNTCMHVCRNTSMTLKHLLAAKVTFNA